MPEHFRGYGPHLMTAAMPCIHAIWSRKDDLFLETTFSSFVKMQPNLCIHFAHSCVLETMKYERRKEWRQMS